MVPLVGMRSELDIVKATIDATAAEIAKAARRTSPRRQASSPSAPTI
jgi:hypothetical protein